MYKAFTSKQYQRHILVEKLSSTLAPASAVSLPSLLILYCLLTPPQDFLPSTVLCASTFTAILTHLKASSCYHSS